LGCCEELLNRVGGIVAAVHPKGMTHGSYWQNCTALHLHAVLELWSSSVGKLALLCRGLGILASSTTPHLIPATNRRNHHTSVSSSGNISFASILLALAMKKNEAKCHLLCN
jgi:hypothetical protein